MSDFWDERGAEQVTDSGDGYVPYEPGNNFEYSNEGVTTTGQMYEPDTGNDYQDSGTQDNINDYDVTRAVYDSAPIGSGIEQDTFWEDPVRIGRYKHAMDTAGPDWPAPDWMPVATVNQLYDILKDLNGDKPFYQWDKTSVPEEMRAVMRSMPAPPPEVMKDDEAWKYNMQGMGMMPKQGAVNLADNVYAIPVDEFSKTFPGVTGYKESNGSVIIPQAQLDQLLNQQQAAQVQKPTIDLNAPENQPKQKPTTWQDYILPGIGAIISTAGGAAVGGAVGGIPGAIAGGAIGAGIPGIAALGATDDNSWYNQPAKAVGWLLEKANIPAEEVEKALGTIVQGERALGRAAALTTRGQNIEAAEAVADYVNNIGAAYQAGAAFYNTGLTAPEGQKQEDWSLYGKQANPDQLKEMAMEEARRRIVDGEDAKTVTQDIEGRYGLAGYAAEFAGQMILDPLNLVGMETVKGIGKVANIMGNVPLAKAAEGANIWSDVIELGIKYRNELQALPVDTRAGLAAWNKLMGGLDNLGNLKAYAVPKYANMSEAARAGLIPAIKTLFGGGLTAMSRANAMSNNHINGLALLLEREEDPKAIYNAIKSVADMKPGDPVRILDETDPLHLFDGAEMQHIPGSVKESMKAVDEVMSLYDTTRDNRKFIDNTAGLIGMTPQQLMIDIAKAPEGRAKILAQEAMDKLAAMSQDPNIDPKIKAQAAAMLEGGDRDALAAQLQHNVKLFMDKDGAPYDVTVLKTKMLNALSDGAGKYASDYFGIKPNSKAAIVGNILKQAQGYFLLGLNPSYLANNVLNNLAMLAHDGLMGYHNIGGKNIVDEFGVSSSRYGESFTPVDIEGGLGSTESKARIPIAESQRKENSKLQSFSDWMKPKGDWKWLQPMQVLSGKAEGWASQRAQSAAFRQFYYGHWRPGVGFDPLPSQLAQRLDAIQPGLSEAVTGAVSSAKKAGDISNKVFSSLGEGVDNVTTPDIMLFANKQQADILAHMPDIVEDANAKLAKAKTPEARRQVFADLRDEAQGRVNEQVVANVEKMVAEAAQKVMTEGLAGAVDSFDQIARMRYDFWIEHFRNMDQMFEKADTMTPKERRAFVNHELNLSGKSWNTQQNIEGAKLLGIVRGLGDDVAYGTVKQALFDQHNTWRGFYNERSRLVNEFYDWKDKINASKEQASARWAEIQAELDNQYVAAFDIEADSQSRIDNILADVMEKQGIDRNDTMNWRSNVSDVRETIRDAIRYFRSGQGTPAEPLRAAIDTIIGGGRMGATKSQMWDRFVNEVYNPLIANHMQAGGMPRQPHPDEVMAQQQAMEQAAIAQQEAVKAAQKPEPKVELKPEQDGVQVPVMITNKMRADLRDMGVTDAEIRELTPQQAWDRLNQGKQNVEPKVEQPPVELSPEQRRSEIRQIAKDYGVTADKHMKNIAGQPDGKLEDIDPEQFRAALEARKAEKGKPQETATVTDLEKQLNVEPEVQAGISNAREFDDWKVRGLEEFNKTGDDSLLRSMVGKGIDHLKQIVGEDIKQIEFTFGRFLGDNEPTIYLKINADDAKIPEILYATSKVAKESFAQDAVILSRDAPNENGFGLRVKNGTESMIEPIATVKFAEALTPEQIQKVNAAIDAVGIGGYTITPDKMAIEIMRVDRYNKGEYGTANDFTNKITGFLGELDGTGILYNIRRGLKEVWTVGQAGSGSTPGTYDYGKYHADFEGRYPEAAARIQKRLVDNPYNPQLPKGFQPPSGDGVSGGGQQPQNLPVGTYDNLQQFPPIEEAAHELWMSKVDPMLSEMSDKAATWTPAQKMDAANMPKDVLNELKKYIAQQENNLASTKAGAMRYSDAKRDFALLDYGNKTFMDNAFSAAFPYQFWYTHTMLNWALRAMVRPNVIANFERMRNFIEDSTDREGMPYRLRDKMELQAPYLEDWTGSKVYVDPMKQVYPFLQMFRPWEKLAKQNNMETRRAESTIRNMVEDEEITPEQGAQALQQRQGDLWNKAVSRAKSELDEEISNPVDFLFSVYSPALPVSMAWDLVNGHPERINKLPIANLIQNITAPFGIGGPRGVDIMPALGGEYEDGRVDRMLAYLSGEGRISADEARRAMIDRRS